MSERFTAWLVLPGLIAGLVGGAVVAWLFSIPPGHAQGSPQAPTPRQGAGGLPPGALEVPKPGPVRPGATTVPQRPNIIDVPSQGVEFVTPEGRIVAKLWYGHEKESNLFGGHFVLYDSFERPAVQLHGQPRTGLVEILAEGGTGPIVSEGLRIVDRKGRHGVRLRLEHNNLTQGSSTVPRSIEGKLEVLSTEYGRGGSLNALQVCTAAWTAERISVRRTVRDACDHYIAGVSER